MKLHIWGLAVRRTVTGDTWGIESERYIIVAINAEQTKYLIRMKVRLNGSWLDKASSRALANWNQDLVWDFG